MDTDMENPADTPLPPIMTMEDAFVMLTQAMQTNNTLLATLTNHQTQASNNARTEIRVEGLQIPKYSGRMNESVGLYIHKCKMYFQAKRMDFTIPEVEQRCIALMAANLTGVAASWLQDRVASLRTLPETLNDLETN